MADNTTPNWTEADERALRLAVLDLSRLLRCMEQQEAPPELSWRSIEGRGTLAQDLWRKVQEGWHASTYTDESFRAEDEARFVQLQRQVEKACRRGREIAAERKGNEVDLIQEIFFPEKNNSVVVNEEEKKDSGVDEEHHDAHSSVDQDDNDRSSREEERHQVTERTPTSVSRSTAQDVEELQKAQREQLEAEISHMAARLKESTQQMNTTLRTQTEVRTYVSYMNIPSLIVMM